MHLPGNDQFFSWRGVCLATVFAHSLCDKWSTLFLLHKNLYHCCHSFHHPLSKPSQHATPQNFYSPTLSISPSLMWLFPQVLDSGGWWPHLNTHWHQNSCRGICWEGRVSKKEEGWSRFAEGANAIVNKLTMAEQPNQLYHSGCSSLTKVPNDFNKIDSGDWQRAMLYHQGRFPWQQRRKMMPISQF